VRKPVSKFAFRCNLHRRYTAAVDAVQHREGSSAARTAAAAAAKQLLADITEPGGHFLKSLSESDRKAVAGRVVASLPGGCQIEIGYVDHTGCRQLVSATIRPTRVALTPGGGQIGYVDHTGCHQLNRVFDGKITR
jgi:hypothetical protein